MQIAFGWCADAAAWSDARSAATGRVRMGPRGLVRLLQTRLGLSRPETSPAVRTAQYLAALQADPPSWCAESLALDPWATARAVLARRDAAVEAGWRPAEHDPTALPPRLAAIAQVERRLTVAVGAQPAAVGTVSLAPGAADDLVEVLAALEEEQRWPLGLGSIVCDEAPDSLPGSWPRLLRALAAAGVAVEHAADEEPGTPQLTVITAAEEWTAARTAARFLASSLDTAGDDSVHVLATADTVVLDPQMHRRGLPAIGRASASTDRAAHQILPLFLALAIAPVDVRQVAAYLDLRVADALDDEGEPLGLVPAAARRALLAAIAKQPGVGGSAWASALEHLDSQAGTGDEGDARRHARAAEAAHALDDLIANAIPPGAVRPAALLAALGSLEERLRALVGVSGALAETMAQLATFRAVLESLDGAPLAPRTLQMIVEASGGRGASPLARPEAGPFTVVADPSHLRASGGTVLWWGAEQAADPRPLDWDVDEQHALASAGARPVDPQHLAALGTDAALRGLRTAGRVIAIVPERRMEQAVQPSSLLTHLASALAPEGTGAGEALAARTIRAADLVADGTWELAGRHRARAEDGREPSRSPEGADRGDLTRHIAPAPQLAPQRLSYSQAETLVGCRQKWAYRYGFGLSPGSAATVPTGNQMIGTLVHAVVEELVRADATAAATWPPDGDAIAAQLDAVIPSLASELELPGNARTRARVRATAVASLVEFFDRLATAGIRITGTESGFSEELPLHHGGGTHAVGFNGSRDVDGEDAAGRPVVIDLKWSASKKKHAELFDRGESLQLASYAWSLNPDGSRIGPDRGGRPVLAYYLLAQGEFVSDDGRLDDRPREPFDPADTWDRMVREIESALDDITAGTVTARSGQALLDAGLGPDASSDARRKAYAPVRDQARGSGGIWVDVRCDYCEFSVLCGLRKDLS